MIRKPWTYSAAAAAVGMTAALGITTGGVAPANAATCTNTHSYSHSVTSRGTQTQTWTAKHKCGRDYTENEHRVTHSYTGAVTDMRMTKVMYAYPHWREHRVTESVSKAGTVTVRTVNTSG